MLRQQDFVLSFITASTSMALWYRFPYAGSRKDFGSVTAVDQANLDVNGGEFLVIVGESGCGKTTTLRLIAGLEQPDGGTIFINGTPVNDVAVDQRANDFSEFRPLAAYEGFRRAALNQPIPAASSEEMVQRQDHRVPPPARMENRHRRKFLQTQTDRALGRTAAARGPGPRHGHVAVMLMDEPLSNIDPPNRLKMRQEILAFHKENRLTTLYVTHNLADGIALADRIAVMHEGRFEQADTPEQLMRNPVNDYVADFFKAEQFSHRISAS